MNKFLIAATDIRTNATVYGRISCTGHDLRFREGPSIVGAGNHAEGLFMDPSQGSKLDADVACGLLAMHTRRVAELKSPWVRDLRLVLA